MPYGYKLERLEVNYLTMKKTGQNRHSDKFYKRMAGFKTALVGQWITAWLTIYNCNQHSLSIKLYRAVWR